MLCQKESWLWGDQKITVRTVTSAGGRTLDWAGYTNFIQQFPCVKIWTEQIGKKKTHIRLNDSNMTQTVLTGRGSQSSINFSHPISSRRPLRSWTYLLGADRSMRSKSTICPISASGYPVRHRSRNKGSQKKKCHATNMGLSENSVPLNPMVNDHSPY